MSFLGTFEYTTGKTWGGTQINPDHLKFMSLFGGFFGLDHVLLRSPKTAFLKFVTNLLTFGLWYWYDVIQVFSDMDFVKTYGYTIPILGPVGLGTGILGSSDEKTAAPKDTPSPWTFLLYILTVFIPFGVSNFVAGDFQGGAVKFAMTFIFFTTIFGLIWTVYSGLYSFFKPESLFTRGVDRIFPASLFLGKSYGDAPNLMPPKLGEVEEEIESSSGFFNKIYNMIFGIVEKPLLKTAVSLGEPLVNTAQTIEEVAKNTSAPTPTKEQVGGALNAVASTALVMASQHGGAPDSNVKYLFLASALAVFVGAITVTYLRFWSSKKNDPSKHSEQNDVPPEGFKNDTPPGPRVL